MYLDLYKNLSAHIPSLSLVDLKKLEIPVPPLSTQKVLMKALENLKKQLQWIKSKKIY